MALETSVDGRSLVISEKQGATLFLVVATILVALGLIFVFLRVYESPIDFMIGGIFLIIGAFVFMVGLGSFGKMNTWTMDLDQRVFSCVFEENSESYPFDSIQFATAGRDEGPAAILQMKENQEQIVVVGFESRSENDVELLIATVNTVLVLLPSLRTT